MKIKKNSEKKNDNRAGINMIKYRKVKCALYLDKNCFYFVVKLSIPIHITVK